MEISTSRPSFLDPSMTYKIDTKEKSMVWLLQSLGIWIDKT